MCACMHQDAAVFVLRTVCGASNHSDEDTVVKSVTMHVMKLITDLTSTI